MPIPIADRKRRVSILHVPLKAPRYDRRHGYAKRSRVSIGSPLDLRTQPLNRKREWREWSGYLAASQYDYLHIHEYVGIRHAAVLIDVSPLYKYRIRGADAVRLIDRVI